MNNPVACVVQHYFSYFFVTLVALVSNLSVRNKPARTTHKYMTCCFLVGTITMV